MGTFFKQKVLKRTSGSTRAKTTAGEKGSRREKDLDEEEPSIFLLLSALRLKWYGHFCRLPEDNVGNKSISRSWPNVILKPLLCPGTRFSYNPSSLTQDSGLVSQVYSAG